MLKALINLGDVGTPSYAFLDWMKGATFIVGGQPTPDFPAYLDTNGMPLGTHAADINGSFPLSTLEDGYAGNFVVKWSGKGALNLKIGVTIVSSTGTPTSPNVSVVPTNTSSNTVISGTDVRVVFKFAVSGVNQPHASVSFAFPTPASGIAYASMTSLVLARSGNASPDDESRLSSGEIFTTDYKAVVASLNPATIRTMDWCNANLQAQTYGGLTRYAYRTPVASLGWISSYFPPNAWAGSTSGTDTYTCGSFTDNPGSWVDGMTVQVRFTNTNTSTTPTISVSGISGAKTMIDFSGTNALSASAIKTDRPSTLVYDAKLDKVLYGAGGIAPNVPIEAQVRLANDLNVNLWHVLPHLVPDSEVANFVTYARDNLVNKLYLEFGNELWNTFFNGGLYAIKAGQFYGWVSGANRATDGWYGLRVRRIMAQATTTWTASRSRTALKCVMGSNAIVSDIAGHKIYRLEGTDLNGTSFTNYAAAGFPNYDTAPNRPIDFCDVISYATYYQGAILTAAGNYGGTYGAGDLSGITGAADNYALGTNAGIDAAFQWIDNDIRQGTKNGADPSSTLKSFAKAVNNTGVMYTWELVAAAYDGARPVGMSNLTIENYEGGIQCSAPTTGNCTTIGISTTYATTIANMLEGYRNSSYAKRLASDQMRQMMGLDKAAATYGLLPHSTAPAWYQFQNNPPWSLLPGGIYTTPYKMFDGVQSFNGGKRTLKW